MKKLISFFSVLTLLFSLTACGGSSDEVITLRGEDSCAVTVACAEESSEENYIITYWGDRIASPSGDLRVQNTSDFPITVYLSAPGDNEIALPLLPEEEQTVTDLDREEPYQVGVYADVGENDEITLLLTAGA